MDIQRHIKNERRGITNMNPEKERYTSRTVRRGAGITVKLLIAVVASIIIAVGALLIVVYNQMSHALLEKNDEILHTTTDMAIQETKAWMNMVLVSLNMQRDTIEYENMNTKEIKEYIKYTAGQNEAYPAGLYVALTDGSLYHASFVPEPGFNVLSRSWYQDGVESEEFILGDVYFDENSQSYVVGAFGVLKDSSGSVRGVAAADVYLDSISGIVSKTQIEDTGGIFLVDMHTDTIIGHNDNNILGKKLGEIKGGIYEYAQKQIKAGKMELSLYKDTYIQVAQVPDSNWAAVSYVQEGEALRELKELTVLMLYVTVAALVLVTVLVAVQIRRIIGVPVRELSQVATRIAEGDLEQGIRYKSKDELGVLADNFNRVTLRLRDYVIYIDEIAGKLNEIAEGNLAFTLENEYSGEFAKIKNSLDTISVELNNTMGQLNAASVDVAAGAAQVSDSAMMLSQGSSEQASEVESLAGHISAVSQSISQIAQGAGKAESISQDVRKGLLDSNEKMENLKDVIQKISNKSTEIGKIIKIIDGIAFQTNILALNAAVEAARAGEAGKGFAVVADEVRSLAGKSSEAAQKTTDLLGETISSMEESVKAVQLTAESIMSVAVQADEMDSLVGGIADFTKQQAADAEEITQGISQISIVVQNNVATVQESAAASDELSGQAAALKELVKGFRLKE